MMYPSRQGITLRRSNQIAHALSKRTMTPPKKEDKREVSQPRTATHQQHLIPLTPPHHLHAVNTVSVNVIVDCRVTRGGDQIVRWERETDKVTGR